MGKSLFVLLFSTLSLLFCSNVMAEQEVLTAYPKTGEFKFVWSSTSAVYKSQDGKVTVRCNFDDSFQGVDDGAEPYIASSFLCKNADVLTSAIHSVTPHIINSIIAVILINAVFNGLHFNIIKRNLLLFIYALSKKIL